MFRSASCNSEVEERDYKDRRQGQVQRWWNKRPVKVEVKLTVGFQVLSRQRWHQKLSEVAIPQSLIQSVSEL